MLEQTARQLQRTDDIVAVDRMGAAAKRLKTELRICDIECLSDFVANAVAVNAFGLSSSGSMQSGCRSVTPSRRTPTRRTVGSMFSPIWLSTSLARNCSTEVRLISPQWFV
ncbi:MAG: hypothetical protein BGO24_14220 [Sphingomonas sp. 67-36]|nr:MULTISPECIES: hypothetical protein [unclassified Sphingomonas]MBN8849661.1 hypothetical protein [Sphingomonas sp.]OJV29997.1 MAG: hypothetical protein BGO24_14220 [Sphingomonas sp. 67-36]